MSWKRLDAVLSCRVGCGLSARLSSHLLLSSQPSQGFLCSLLQLPFAPSRMMVVMIGLAGRHLNNCGGGGYESLCNKQLLLTKKKKKPKTINLQINFAKMLGQPKDKWAMSFSRKWVWNEAEESREAMGKVRVDEGRVGSARKTPPGACLRAFSAVVTPPGAFSSLYAEHFSKKQQFHRWTLRVPLDYGHLAWLI